MPAFFDNLMKIGLLLPRSVLYPSIAFDITDGLKTGLRTRDASPEIVTANIGVAAKNDEIYAACEQLLLGGARTVIAYINPASAEFIHPLFENSGSLLLVLDSGYLFQSSLQKLSHAFYLSLQGALCCRVTGRLAMEAGNRNFAYVTSFYDAGYRAGYTFGNSLMDHGGQIVFNHVTPLRRSEFSLEPVSNFIRENAPDGMLAAFCGDMAEDFLREAGRSDWFAGGRVYGSPFMAEELWLEKIPYPGHDWICAVPWARLLDTPENQNFVAEMDAAKPGKANVFSVLAWEAALLLSEISPDDTVEKNVARLEGLTFRGPRGEMHISADKHIVEAPVYRAVVGKDDRTGNCRVTDLQPIAFTEEERGRYYEDVRNLPQYANTWLNAYACLDS